ncbi:MAG: hypothetical protein R3F61_00010 [Myxococcota bacterium]
MSLLSAGCAFDGADSSSWASAPHTTSRCEVTGTAALPGAEAASGTITGGDTGATGSWLHDSPVGGVILATPDFITCRINGSKLADVEGTAEVDGVPGYTYRIHVQDRGTPGGTVIHEGTPVVETLTATRSYRHHHARWTDAVLPITEDMARVTIPAELPVTVGAPGTGRADLVFTRADTGDTTRCRYRGNGRRDRGGDRYVLTRCVGRSGSPEVVAGDEVDVTALTIHVQSGDEHSSGCRGGETTVTLDLDVLPLSIEPSQPDYYEIRVFSPDGTDYFDAAGNLEGGDLTITEF